MSLIGVPFPEWAILVLVGAAGSQLVESLINAWVGFDQASAVLKKLGWSK